MRRSVSSRGGSSPLGQPKAAFLVEDDLFAVVLEHALTRAGLSVKRTLDGGALHEAMAQPQRRKPAYAVLEIGASNDSRLCLLARLIALNPACRIVVLCAADDYSAAAKAIRLGAVDAIFAPVASVSLVARLLANPRPDRVARSDHHAPESIDAESIVMALRQHAWNIAATARCLNMPRNALQRLMEQQPDLFRRPR
jgi:ActR/RegA family two-component response regulator